MKSRQAKKNLEKLKKEKSLLTYDKTGVEEAVEALDNMYNDVIAKKLKKREGVINEQKTKIADLENRLDKAADFCVETQEENEALIEENKELKSIIEQLARENAETKKHNETTEKHNQEEERLIREYLSELMQEKETLLGRIDSLGEEIKKVSNKKQDSFSMWSKR